MKTTKKKILLGIIIAALGLVLLAGGLYGCLYLWIKTEPPPLYAHYELPDSTQTRQGFQSSIAFRGKSLDGFRLPSDEFGSSHYAYCTITAPPGTTLYFSNASKPGEQRYRLGPETSVNLRKCPPDFSAVSDSLGWYVPEVRAYKEFYVTVPNKPGHYKLEIQVCYHVNFAVWILAYFQNSSPFDSVNYYYYLEIT